MRRTASLFAMMFLCPAQVLLPPQAAQAETVQLIKPGNVTAIGHTFDHGGECRVLSVRHFLSTPGKHYRAYRPGATSPEKANLELGERPSSRQGSIDADFATLSDWDLRCGNPLSGIGLNAFSSRLERISVAPNTERFVLQIVNGPSSRPVDIWIEGEIRAETFIIAARTQDMQGAPDRAGISGSGVFLGQDLVGLVTGPAPGRDDAYEVLRIEMIIQALGLFDPQSGETAAERPGTVNQEAPAAANPMAVVYPAGITECDRLAANPTDEGRHPEAAGLKRDTIDVVQAVLACEQALADTPDSPRLAYQYARALTQGYEVNPARFFFAKAVSATNKALDLGHVHAIYNFAEILYLRANPDCGGPVACDLAYLDAVAKLTPFAPDEAAFRRADMLAFSGNRAAATCPDLAACDLEAAQLFSTITGGRRQPLAAANLAFLIMDRNTPWTCPEDDDCFTFMRRAFYNASNNRISWGKYQLGRLYRLRGLAAGGCTDQEDCNHKSVLYWEGAAKDGDARGYLTIGEMATEPGWAKAVGCKDEASCSKTAYDNFVLAAKDGNTDAHGRAASMLAWQTADTGCGDETVCHAALRGHLTDEGFAATAWGKSMRADLLLEAPDRWSDLCSAPDCLETAISLYRASSEMGRGYASARLAELYSWPYVLKGPGASVLSALGCTTFQDCRDRAAEFYALAHEQGRGGVLYEWFALLMDEGHGNPARFAALFPAWRAAADQTAPGLNSWLDAEFLGLSAQFDTYCGDLAQWCRKRSETILDYALTEGSPNYITEIALSMTCEQGGCDDRRQQILLRAAAIDPTGFMAKAALTGLLDKPVCAEGATDCLTVRQHLEASDDLVATLNHRFPLTKDAWPRATEKDLDWLRQRATRAGSATARYWSAYALINGLKLWSDMTDADAEFATRAHIDFLLSNASAPSNMATLCTAATRLLELTWTNRYYGTLDTDALADLGLLRLAYCAGFERERPDLTLWFYYENKAVIQAIQRRLGVTPDGDFGEVSWQAAGTMAESLFTQVTVVSADGSVTQTVNVSTAPDEVQQKTRAALRGWTVEEALERARIAFGM